MTELNNKFGEVKISDEVIAKVASIAVADVKGAVGINEGTSGIFGMRNKTKGVRVESKDGNLNVDVDIVVEYETKMSEVAEEAQEKIKKAIESMTSLNVSRVNILIKGIKMPSETTEE